MINYVVFVFLAGRVFVLLADEGALLLAGPFFACLAGGPSTKKNNAEFENKYE
jgi:hypothetical protein